MYRFATALFCLPTLAHADVNVVTDIAPIHSITAQIMGETGTPALLLPPGANAHDFQFRPSDAQAMQDADVVIVVGGGLTPWLEGPVESLASSAAVLTLTETDGWTPLEIREEHDHGHGHDDHEGHDDHDDRDDHEGHDHDAEKEDDGHDDHADHDGHDDHDDHKDHDDHAEMADPHAWVDPEVMIVWATNIAETLSAQDPDKADVYAANLATTVAALTTLDTELSARVSGTAPLLWPHDGYQYFEVAYDLNAKGSIANVNAATPGPGRIRDLQALVTEDSIACVLTDAEINGDWIGVVADGVDVKTGFIDNMGAGLEPGPALYPAMMNALADTISTCASE